jgi:dipeptidyl aminopeptidase/acylaminoacyl peptidase
VEAPTLIVHGTQDEVIPLAQVQRLFGSLRVGKRLDLIPGADHGFTRREDFTRMTQTLVNWLAR